MTGSSLGKNPPNAGRHLTAGGSDWLWAVFAIMALSDLGMIMWSFTFVRYIQWFITFPLLLILLLYTSGLALSDILTTAFFAWVVVVCGLVGALTVSTYKWGFFILGVAALLYIWSSLLGHGPRSTFNGGAGVRSGYVRGASFVAFLTMLYPICWGLSEGGNVISITGEMIWYGILDLLLGPVFLYYFVWGLRSVDYGLFGFNSGKHTDGGYATGAGAGAGYGHSKAGMGGAGMGNAGMGGAGNGATIGQNGAGAV
ncbi:hypothetical protein PHLCEN_2v245 [Hermanssonia centrifuga]|uniref:Uncharacterized protein n=1 Tax=Hermanssonia centrifuga TaxID=98765 RepID=A0A2R6S6N2_9APHY|nr:hypothetical protein PHLCEN_2v245 [Hermanssonia centrifuga]